LRVVVAPVDVEDPVEVVLVGDVEVRALARYADVPAARPRDRACTGAAHGGSAAQHIAGDIVRDTDTFVVRARVLHVDHDDQIVGGADERDVTTVVAGDALARADALDLDRQLPGTHDASVIDVQPLKE